MTPSRKRWLAFIQGMTVIAIILNMVTPAANYANAQDVTAEPTPAAEVTAEPTVSETPATEPTAPPEATADVTTEPTAEITPEQTSEATLETTPEPTAEVTPEPITLLFQDDFQDGDTLGWNLTPGWQVSTEAENLFLSTTLPNETATIADLTTGNFSFSARVRVDWENKATIAFRSSAESYKLVIDHVLNTASLYRGEELLGQISLTIPAADENGVLPVVWHPVTIQAAGSAISATVDGLVVASYIDPTPLADGSIFLTTDAANTGVVAIDDIVIMSATPAVTTPEPLPTAEVTEPAPTAEVTVEPEITPEATVEPGVVLINTDFESEILGWALGDGLSVVEAGEGNHALLFAPSATLLPADTLYLADFRLDVRLNLASGATDGTTGDGLSIPFRTQDGNTYNLSVESTQTVLSRNDGTGATVIASSPTAHALNTWHSLALEAIGEHLTVTVNGVVEIDVTDEAPLTGGQIAFIASAASSVLLDDISVTDFSSGAGMAPTPEPFGLGEAERAKLPNELTMVLDVLLAGNETTALALAKANLLPVDENNNILVSVWGAEGETGESLAALAGTLGGTADYVYPNSIEVRLPLSAFIPLVNTPQVAAINLVSVLSSTSSFYTPLAAPVNAPIGAVSSEGFDVLSANDWHKAGILGAGQRIGVIDTGFVGLGAETSCASLVLGGLGTTNHGSRVAQVICDVAPSAAVRLYGVTTPSTLATAITSASASNDIIVITMDMGVDNAPGDATGGGYPDVESVYTALATAKTNGKLIIASAGNGNWWLDDDTNATTGRYFTMQTGAGGLITIPLQVYPGDILRVGWNDWDSTPNNGGTRENFDIFLNTSGAPTIAANVTINDATAVRAAGIKPGDFYTVTAANCPTGPCNANLLIGGTAGVGTFGNATGSLFQVQISGKGVMFADDITGENLQLDAGTIARPGDSANVVTIGAVCVNENLRYPVSRDSSTGPIFAAGGNLNGAPATATPIDFKPNFVGPTNVSVSGSKLDDASPIGADENCTDGTYGFEGTSASAAHIAAMAALVRAKSADINVNPSAPAAMTRQQILNYLYSHTVEFPLGANANGHDFIYGAGMPTLGNPLPPQAITSNLTAAVPGGNCPGGGLRYVRPLLPTTNSDTIDLGTLGSFTNPYFNVMEAIKEAPGAACIVLMPGEYVTGMDVSSVPNNLRLRSYDYAYNTVSVEPSSYFWTNIVIGEGGLDVRDTNFSVQGFIFLQADALDPAGKVVFNRPRAISYTRASGGTISHNVFTGFTPGTSTKEGRNPVAVIESNGVFIENNIFTLNNAPAGAALSITGSGATTPITVQRNLFTENTYSGLNNTLPQPTVLINDAAVRLYNNRFLRNSTAALVFTADSYNGVSPYDNAGGTGRLPMQFFGNSFSQNTNSGPVIYLYPGKNFRFINNTVAGNVGMGSTYVIQRGSPGPIPGTGLNGGGQWEIHNNIFYNNGGGTLLSLIEDPAIVGVGTCDSIDGGAPAQYNWSFNSGGTTGICQVSLSGNNNEFELDPGDPLVDADASQFVGPTIAPDDPYQPKNTSYAFDRANEPLILAANPALIGVGGVDALGKSRKDGQVDLGAYEFKNVTATDVDLTGGNALAEDYIDPIIKDRTGTTLPVIQIIPVADGGFPPYSYEVVSNPLNFSTNLDNACGGLPAFFNSTVREIYYCPPVNFYNQGIADPAAAVSFQYRVRDNAGNMSAPATINIELTKVADAPLSTAFTGYTVIGLANQPVTIRLRPYARFDNFRLAAPGTPVQPDYPYTFSNPDVLTLGESAGINPNLFGDNFGQSEGHILGNFDGGDGVFTLTPNDNQTGYMEFTYTATDDPATNPGAPEPDSSTNNKIRVLIVGALPEGGLQDDASLLFNYLNYPNHPALTNIGPGSWTPIYNEIAVNNTLHQTTALNDAAEFIFDGSGFALYMQGAAAGAYYQLEVENAGVPVPLTWQAVTGVTNLYRASNGGISCRVNAPVALTGIYANMIANTGVQPYVVSCTGLLDGEANLVRVVNKQAGRILSVDGIGILQETTPLRPGVHEVTEAQLISTFFGWTQEVQALAAGSRAVSTSSTGTDLRFNFIGGTGFAVGTALQRTAAGLGVKYKICVAEALNASEVVCNRYDNGVGATTALTWKVFRPFYGFDPSKEYIVTVDITDVPTLTPVSLVKLKMYVDSIVVFDQRSTATLPLGTTENDLLGPIVFDGGNPDSWLFDTNNVRASNKSLTSVVTTVPKVGPFFSFTVPAGADTFNWYRLAPGTLDTTQALICVDRARFNLPGTEDNGNCIVLNTRTGLYFQITAGGGQVVDPTPVTVGLNPLTITQDMFRNPWGTATPHIVEVSSLTNEGFNVDKIQVLDGDAPLNAGSYEENAPGLRFFTEDGGVYTLHSSGNLGNFKDVVNALASGGRVRVLSADNSSTPAVDKTNLKEGFLFQFYGTGFGVNFTLDNRADAVKICWQNDGGAPAVADDGLVTTILSNLNPNCQTFDNQSVAVRYKASRTIAGLVQSNYSVAVQMLDDQGEPVPHIVYQTPLTMTLDGVEVYNHQPMPGTILTDTTKRYETSYVNRVADNTFVYFGAGWKSVTGTAARLYSGSNYDSVLNVIGAGVAFRTNNVANVIIYRDTRAGFAPMQVCVNRLTPVSRRCTIITNNGGTGYQQPIVVPLFDTTAHTVTIATTDFGTLNLDAIQVSNTPLDPGIYDENDPALVYSASPTSQTPIDTDPLVVRPVYSHWRDIILASYVGGGAMQSQLTTPVTITNNRASVQFQFNGTGFSLLTLFDTLSAKLDVDICNGPCDSGNNDFNNIVFDSYSTVARYASSHSVTGLPNALYTVTITENDTTTPTARRRFTVDGVQVYGPLTNAMPVGLYDDTARNAAGDSYFVFGPSNAAWTPKTGTLAPASLNQTNQLTSRYGANVTFNAQATAAITLFHSGSTSTKVEVCAVRIGVADDRDCEIKSLVGRVSTTFLTPFDGGSANYYVSITNLGHAQNFFFDAVALHGTAAQALTEGIYHDNNDVLAPKFLGASWLAGSVAEAAATDKLVKSTGVGNAGDNLEFTFNGTGVSVVLVEATTTSANYTVCIDDDVTIDCDVVNAPLSPVGATAARRPVALTYVGLTPATYTLRLTNNDATKPMLVDRVDVLGALATEETIAADVTGNIENNDKRITYFPFFSYNPLANVLASDGNQNTGTMQGSVIYFEMLNVPGGGRTFEYVRQTLATYGQVQVCSGSIGVNITNAAACGGNVTVTPNPILNNVLPVGYQKSQLVTIAGSGNTRWVALRNFEGKVVPLDFIRPVIAGQPLTPGYFEETHPELQYTGTFTDTLAPAASGGSVKVTTTVNNALLFRFDGTGFSTYFTFDPKADAVKICYRPGTHDLAASQNEGAGARCTTYDNQSAVARYKAARTIVGLTSQVYTASVQMLADNNLPTPHLVANTPISMQIDAVRIYDDALPGNILDDSSIRYETSFANRVAEDTFLYYGSAWKSVSGTAARLYSGSNYDNTINVIGASVVFRTSGANGILLYRQTAAAFTPVEVCAISATARTCTIVTNNVGAGYQQPAGVLFSTTDTSDRVVTITTLDAGTLNLDAIQLIDTTDPLQPGLYEDTYPGLAFTNFDGTSSGSWTEVVSTLYSGGRARQSITAGAANGDMLRFSLTNATGFEIGMGVDRWGGEVQVCYDDNAGLTTPDCFIYQNERAVASNFVSRSVTGLTTGTTYYVRVRHVEDGNATIAPIGPRPVAYTPSRLRIDYVNVFAGPAAPIVTEPGVYNENATDGTTPYLQLLPANRWGSFSGATLGRGFSNLSYIAVVDNAKRASALYAGPTATLRVDVPDTDGITVILSTGTAIASNTDKMLVCADNVGNDDVNPPSPVGLIGATETTPGPECVIIANLRTTNQIILNPAVLTALDAPGTHRLSFRALTPGLFRIDGFQIIHGDVLTPGIYDDVLAGPDGLLDTEGTWILPPTVTAKYATAFGGSHAIGSGNGARMTFDFEGTGFSMVTTTDTVGVDVRVCYKVRGDADPFPAVGDTTFTDDATLGVFCRIFTTDTNTVILDWNTKNGTTPRPALAPQYGLTIHGLTEAVYSAEITLVRPTVAAPPIFPVALAATDRLKIDAIVVFADVTDNPALASAPNGQFYDDRQAGILYEPGVFWTQGTSLYGPTRGPWNLTETYATNAGAVVQLHINGNGFILYQTASPAYSRNVRVCIKTSVGEECSDFSQAAPRLTYFTPVAFYGFGSVDQQVVIENRDHGRRINIDGIRILP